jgi:hypothetical protein
VEEEVVYGRNEGVGMEERRRELATEVRRLDLCCRQAGENFLSTSASLSLLGDELEAMSHGQLRRRGPRIAEALALVRAVLPSPSAVQRVRHLKAG